MVFTKETLRPLFVDVYSGQHIPDYLIEYFNKQRKAFPKLKEHYKEFYFEQYIDFLLQSDVVDYINKNMDYHFVVEMPNVLPDKIIGTTKEKFRDDISKYYPVLGNQKSVLVGWMPIGGSDTDTCTIDWETETFLLEDGTLLNCESFEYRNKNDNKCLVKFSIPEDKEIRRISLTKVDRTHPLAFNYSVYYEGPEYVPSLINEVTKEFG